MKKQSTANTSILDKQFKAYNQVYHTLNKRVLLLISSLMLMLGLLGILWAIPFPHLNWLGQYNGYINWASFFIALAAYYYYRLSPVVCYLIIILLFACSYIITCLQGWEHAGGFSLQLISSLLVGVSLLMVVLINKRMLGKITVWSAFTNWLFAPAWCCSLLLKGLIKKK